jgi:hypothetical protein
MKKILFLFSFVFFLVLDYIIKNNYFGDSIKKNYFKFLGLNYFYIVFILTGIVFFILTLFSCFGIYLISFDNFVFDVDLFKFMSDSGVNNNTVTADATVNINHPRLNVSVPASSINNLAAAASVAGGGGLAIKVAQQVPGGPGVKLAVGAATMLTAQALTAGMARVFNSYDSNLSTNNNKNKLIN